MVPRGIEKMKTSSAFVLAAGIMFVFAACFEFASAPADPVLSFQTKLGLAYLSLAAANTWFALL